MRWLAVLALTASCGFQVSAHGTGDAPLGDAPRDAPGGDGPLDGPADGATDAPTDTPIVPGQITFITEAHGQQANSGHDQVSATLPSPPPGAAYIVILSWYTRSVSVQSLTDTAGNPYTFADEITDNTITQRLYYVPRASPAPTGNTVTAKWTNNAQFCEIRVLEYTGLSQTSMFDDATGTGGSGGPMALGPLVTGHGSELLLASFTGNATGPGTGYTQRLLFAGDLEEDEIALIPGAYTASAPASSGSWIGQLAAFVGE